MERNPNRQPPANYWQIVLGAGTLIIAALSLMNSTSKATRDDMDAASKTARDALDAARKDVRENERRICRLEALEEIGECKR